MFHRIACEQAQWRRCQTCCKSKTAAILIADAVGYSRLSEIDEEGTRFRFQRDMKDIFEPKIAANVIRQAVRPLPPAR
ncbi:hypothetical protein [Pararhizobium sp. LjRoot235]|uniref:hypothetical protein n=1 Tax=Pararhizobium sp. LjRoot235 TaxID=3342291 RepID=UPI003F4F7224